MKSSLRKLILPLVFVLGSLNLQAQELPKPEVQQDQRDILNTRIENKIIKDYKLYSFPGLNFGIFPENDRSLERISEDDGRLTWGIYKLWCDSLKINYYEMIRYYKNHPINFDSLLTRTIKHELTHYHIDKFEEKLGIESKMQNEESRFIFDTYLGLLKDSEKNNWEYDPASSSFLNENRKSLEEMLFYIMINEGIAKYYEDPNTKPPLKNCPGSIDDIKNKKDYYSYIYDAGWNLMYPIISAYGEKGIGCVLEDVYIYGSFPDLEKYQKIVLEELAKEER